MKKAIALIAIMFSLLSFSQDTSIKYDWFRSSSQLNQSPPGSEEFAPYAPSPWFTYQEEMMVRILEVSLLDKKKLKIKDIAEMVLTIQNVNTGELINLQVNRFSKKKPLTEYQSMKGWFLVTVPGSGIYRQRSTRETLFVDAPKYYTIPDSVIKKAIIEKPHIFKNTNQ